MIENDHNEDDYEQIDDEEENCINSIIPNQEYVCL